MAFSLTETAYGKAAVSKLDKIKMIPLDQIQGNEQNFYSIKKIEELAETIEMVGLMHPISVVADGAKYRIISGHRRFKAYEKLYLESLPEQKYARIPAIVMNDLDDLYETLALITANATARELTYDEKLQQEKVLRETLMAMKAAGKDVPKNLGQYIADQIGVSRNEVSRMHSVNENLIPEAREKVAAGEMTAQQAYEMSRKPEEEQRQSFAEKMKKDHDRIANEVHAEEEKFMERIEKAFDTLLYGANFSAILHRKDVVVELRRVNMNRGHWGSDAHFSGSAPSLCIYPSHSCADGIRRSWTSVADAMSIVALRRCVAAAKNEAVREQMAIDLDATSDLGTWRRGTPDSPGSYVCCMKLSAGGTVIRKVLWWKSDQWCLSKNGSGSIYDAAEVVGWMKLPEDDPE